MIYLVKVTNETIETAVVEHEGERVAYYEARGFWRVAAEVYSEYRKVLDIQALIKLREREVGGIQ